MSPQGPQDMHTCERVALRARGLPTSQSGAGRKECMASWVQPARVSDAHSATVLCGLLAQVYKNVSSFPIAGVRAADLH